jgi:hypothetical protein
MPRRRRAALFFTFFHSRTSHRIKDRWGVWARAWNILFVERKKSSLSFYYFLFLFVYFHLCLSVGLVMTILSFFFFLLYCGFHPPLTTSFFSLKTRVGYRITWGCHTIHGAATSFNLVVLIEIFFYSSNHFQRFNFTVGITISIATDPILRGTTPFLKI